MCAKDQCLHCSICVLDHSNHMESISIFTTQDIVQHAQKLHESLEKIKKDMIKKQKNLAKIINREMLLEGDHIAELFRASHKLI